MNARVGDRRDRRAGFRGSGAAYRLLIAGLLIANLALAAYAVVVILPNVIGTETGGGPWVPTATPGPTASPTLPASVMADLGVAIGSDADCSACHSAPGETKPRPVMAHPLAGWSNCTSCHETGELIQTAPGHSGLHKEECLVCHTARQDQSPAPRPHHAYSGTACTTCHGNALVPQAPLPATMADRTNCWVCHGLTQGDELWNATTAPVPGTSRSKALPDPTAGTGGTVDDGMLGDGTLGGGTAAGTRPRSEVKPTR